MPYVREGVPLIRVEHPPSCGEAVPSGPQEASPGSDRWGLQVLCGKLPSHRQSALHSPKEAPDDPLQGGDRERRVQAGGKISLSVLSIYFLGHILPEDDSGVPDTSRGDNNRDIDEEIESHAIRTERFMENADTLEGGGTPFPSVHRHESRGE